MSTEALKILYQPFLLFPNSPIYHSDLEKQPVACISWALLRPATTRSITSTSPKNHTILQSVVNAMVEIWSLASWGDTTQSTRRGVMVWWMRNTWFTRNTPLLSLQDLLGKAFDSQSGDFNALPWCHHKPLCRALHYQCSLDAIIRGISMFRGRCDRDVFNTSVKCD